MKKAFHQCKAFLTNGQRCTKECIYNKSKKEYSNWCIDHAQNCNLLNNDYKKSCKGNEKVNCRTNIALSKNKVEEYINFLIDCVDKRRIFENSCMFTDLQDEGHEQFIENLNEKKRICEEYLIEIIEQMKIQEEQMKVRKEETKQRKKERRKQKQEEKAQKEEEKEQKEEEEQKEPENLQDELLEKENQVKDNEILEKLSSLQIDEENISKRRKPKSKSIQKTEQELLDEAIEINKKIFIEERKKFDSILEKIKNIDEKVYNIFINEKITELDKVKDEDINKKLEILTNINYTAEKTFELIIDKKVILEKLSKKLGAKNQKELTDMINLYFPVSYKKLFKKTVYSIFIDFQNENEKNNIRGIDYYNQKLTKINQLSDMGLFLTDLELKLKLVKRVLELKEEKNLTNEEVTFLLNGIFKQPAQTTKSPPKTKKQKTK